MARRTAPSDRRHIVAELIEWILSAFKIEQLSTELRATMQTSEV
jgi:hypothetical protein